MEQRAWRWMKSLWRGVKRFFWWQPTPTAYYRAENEKNNAPQ